MIKFDLNNINTSVDRSSKNIAVSSYVGDGGGDPHRKNKYTALIKMIWSVFILPQRRYM